MKVCFMGLGYIGLLFGNDFAFLKYKSKMKIAELAAETIKIFHEFSKLAFFQKI